MFRSHVSDDELLDWRHGAASQWKSLRVRFHLRQCGVCRSREMELDRLPHRWLEELHDITAVPQVNAEAARERFLFRVSEAGRAPLSGVSPVRPMRLSVGAIVAVCAVAAGVGVWTKIQSGGTRSAIPVPVLLKPMAKAMPERATNAKPEATIERPLIRTLTAAKEPAPSIDDSEIAIYWILHQQRICLRGSVEISRTASNDLSVRGVLESPEERDELESQIRQATRGVPIEVSLAVAGDASQPATVLPAHGHDEAATSAPTTRRPPFGEELIRSHLRNQGTPQERLDAEVNRILNAVVRLSGNLWAESWALRRLDDRFPPAQLRALQLRSRNLFDRMSQDHISALARQFADLQSMLQPMIADVSDLDGDRPESSQIEDISRFASLVEEDFAGSLRQSQPAADEGRKLHALLEKSAEAIRDRSHSVQMVAAQ